MYVCMYAHIYVYTCIPLSLSLYIYIYIYVYTSLSLYMYIYIYTYGWKINYPEIGYPEFCQLIKQENRDPNKALGQSIKKHRVP